MFLKLCTIDKIDYWVTNLILWR